jgi:purine-binding chemotaxis protein CheW
MTLSDKEKKNNETEVDNPRQFIVFKLGEEEYAVSIEDVKEVTYTPVISKMPKTPDFIKGVANIRGEVIAIIDLEQRFRLKSGFKLPKAKSQSFTIVIDVDDIYSVGFITRGIPHTLLINEKNIERDANIIKRSKIQNNFIDGLGKVDERLIIILNIDKILNDKEIKFLTGNKVN